MKLQFKTTEEKLLQVSTFENKNDIVWKTQYPSHRAYSRAYSDIRLNGQK